MLDSETQSIRRPAGVLQGQRIMILGACSGFGHSMARVLAASGAQVVAADSNIEALQQVPGAVPMALKGAPQDAVRRVGRIWGKARLDAVLNLMPLRYPDKVDLNVAVLQSLVQGFLPALSAHQGQIVTLVTRPTQALDVGAGAMGPALVSAQAAFADALYREGLSLNLINVRADAVKPARTAITGLLAQTLGPITGAELRL